MTVTNTLGVPVPVNYYAGKNYESAVTGFMSVFYYCSLGHFVGLLTPPDVYHSLGVSTSAKQILAVIAGGIFGGICFKGIYILIRRRLTDPRIRATSSRMDIADFAV